MLENWRECKLGDVAKLSQNTWKIGDDPMPYIGLEHIEETRLRLNGIGNSENVASNKFRFFAGDTLFGKLRPYFRKVVNPKFDGICSTDIWVLNPQKGINKDFLFYFIANQKLIDISYSASKGTRMPRADWDFLSQTIWNIPPLEEQKAIAEILSSLDDKIDLLHRQNQTLESIAQTLFRQWFIQDAKPEWEEMRLGDFDVYISDYVANGSFATIKENVTLIPDIENYALFMRNTDLKSNFTNKVYVDEHSYNFLRKSKLFGGEILISNVGDVGSVFRCPKFDKPMTLGNNMIMLNSKYNLFFYLLFTSEFGQNLIYNITAGSVQQKFNKTDFRNLKIKFYNIKQLEQFEQIVSDYFLKIDGNKKQIQTLENLRDTLLPKLISGEVRVDVANEYPKSL